MLHPLNMDKEYIRINTSGGWRRVSKKRYVLGPDIPGVFRRYAGMTVRLISLADDMMPGIHNHDNMVVVALDRYITGDGFSVIGDDRHPGTMGVPFKDITPL